MRPKQLRAMCWAVLGFECVVPRVILGAIFVALSAQMLAATDRNVRWGTQPAAGAAAAQSSVTNHLNDAQTAVIVAGGSNTLLPGATVNSVGVLNQISVVGDDNLIDATQSGTNTGDVSTNIEIGN